MHKLRRAMVRPDRDRLDGVVEVDETSVGGRERGKGTAGRGTTNKAVVAIAVEVLEPKGFGWVRLAHLREVNSKSLCGFVSSVVTPGATVRTDRHHALRVLDRPARLLPRRVPLPVLWA